MRPIHTIKIFFPKLFYFAIDLKQLLSVFCMTFY